jgi:hypothetical protein
VTRGVARGSFARQVKQVAETATSPPHRWMNGEKTVRYFSCALS